MLKKCKRLNVVINCQSKTITEVHLTKTAKKHTTKNKAKKMSSLLSFSKINIVLFANNQ